MRKIFFLLQILEKNINVWFLAGVLFLFSILRIPSLVEPDWYGDEGVYQVLGMAIRNGRLLYAGIWDNKPPLLYVIYSIFNGDLYSVRLLSLVFGILSIASFFLLAKAIFLSKKRVYISTIIFAIMFALPLFEGNIANAENFMLFPIILAGYILLNNIKKNNSKIFILASVLLSFAFLIKIVALFDFLAFLIFLFVTKLDEKLSLEIMKSYAARFYMIFKKHKILKIFTFFNREIYFVAAFFIPIVITALFFFLKGAGADFIKATFSQNVGYVGYGNYLILPMGMLIFKSLLLFVFILFVILKRKQIGFTGVFIYIWTAFSFFNALFSERPYHHYLLVLIPSIALLIGHTYKVKKYLVVDLIIAGLFVFILLNNFSIHKRINKYTVGYYSNYLDFLSDKKSIINYQEFFDKNTTRDYQIANFIKSNTTSDQTVFLWSDSPQIYALSGKIPPGRYTVAYHITFYKNGINETQEAINTKKPKYVIVTKNTDEADNFLNNYKLILIMKKSKIYEREV